ncbi:MAG TPA: hypothetical protein VGB64_15125 [Actinomycetota bacterium]
MSLRRIAAPMIAVAALGAGLLVPSAASAVECGRGTTFAKFVQPEGGQLSANTHLGGIAYTAPAAAVPSVMLSTTGQIEVKIEHKCLQAMRLTVYKDGVDAPIHTNTWDPLSCEEAVTTDTVNIGLDGGTYKFVLDGLGCEGVPLTPTEHGGLVGDPPLGL